MADLKTLFAQKFTENGDNSFYTTGNVLLDILFMTEFYQNHLASIPSIGNSEIEKLFAMFIRDGRFGLGRRDVGRALMKKAGCGFMDILTAGRADDLWIMFQDSPEFYPALDFLKEQIIAGNELVKKWMPRYASKNLEVARKIAEYWFPELPIKGGARKCAYGKFIKCDSTVEQYLSRKEENSINFEHVPSLAAVKYAHTFATKETMKDRYAEYIKSVKSGNATLHVATTTCYDIYRNRLKEGFDPDMFFEHLPKISGSFLSVVDTSGSMGGDDGAMGKALAIGHYLAKCSTYMNNHVVTFSSTPTLLELGKENTYHIDYGYWGRHNVEIHTQKFSDRSKNSQYLREIESMHTGDCSNTDFKKVMELIRDLDANNAPEWLVVLSDMEFDAGSNMSMEETMRVFKENGLNTKIVWWNLNSRNTTVPQMKEGGNVYLSGYSPMLLKFLEAGFDGMQFLGKLLAEYANAIGK